MTTLKQKIKIRLVEMRGEVRRIENKELLMPDKVTLEEEDVRDALYEIISEFEDVLKS
jgi:hypothetical protein